MSEIQRVTVDTSNVIATINPYLHGHFAEHLGELFYGGLWVGEDSDIESVNGFRKDAIDALRELHIPVLRWPGGCFADVYHWRDGIGPRAQRPRRLNHNWGFAPESNHVGTHEFIDLCNALETEPYFAGNVGSGTPSELEQWIEYCNFAGSSSTADERRTNGSDSAFGVKFWGVGNENWGCGGNMTAEEYATLYSRYRTFMFDYPGTDLFAIACGPTDVNWQWTKGFFEQLDRQGNARSCRVQGFSAHYYCGSAGTATQYDDAQWLELLARAKAIEGIIDGHRALMDQFDPNRKIELILDEWGAWHPSDPGKPASGLYQQNTIRDACVAALSLDVFNNKADKLYMANIAQVVNVLQAVLLIDGDHCVKTPTYHVFDLYQPHKGAAAVKFITHASQISDGGLSAEHCKKCYLDESGFTLKAIEGSASFKNGELCITFVNTDPAFEAYVEIEIVGSNAETFELVTLCGDNIRSHNTFEQPNIVSLSNSATHSVVGGILKLTAAPGSVNRLIGKVSG